ncbi:ABC transporter substrate-binding protein [Paraburkholderia tropica]|uniref:Amino acid ABC transporter substrate-binding protein (PAAT family) n=1 Tax=Paraburkholderia tropica TaxID=92647 RepID=A0AAQ1GK58_9BURK|nr:polar amino acid transport system substrate-binding protein [Paraburkholderia tropica]MBB3003509.1 polar amino acid transport system substrate-binding protein [Paraburkholderia tropica]MBB6322581.1 polar amino acid transport system substrate-binding protein [Paraburkholderia tropica]PXX11539.1 amino acid ABC transporter substrate-binding protein (PAAT family) [Paraburkholderia tropica]PZW76202.1 amino acid ABC transporter substrate-binding protein (PAAT family) [Paraburkholderia tropica]
MTDGRTRVAMRPGRRRFVTALAALGASPFAAAASSGGDASSATRFDFSPQQRGRPRAAKDAQAVQALGGYALAKAGTLTVAVAPFAPPIATYATDARTIVGADPDYAQLLADALGLSLALVTVAWPDWPLGLASGKYDAVISNVGVTEARKRKFDFTSYRQGLHAFYVRQDSAIRAIGAPADIAGLRIVTDSGTIQERILIEWNRQNAARGVKTASLLYFDDRASARLALLSGRADAIFDPDAPLAFEAATQGGIRKVGEINAGWPARADVGVATRKDSGLAPVLTLATNGVIRAGQYRSSLARWGLLPEALTQSQTNPPGLRDA